MTPGEQAGIQARLGAGTGDSGGIIISLYIEGVLHPSLIFNFMTLFSLCVITGVLKGEQCVGFSIQECPQP